MNANVLIPAHIEQMPEGAIAETLRAYRTSLVSTPLRGSLDDSSSELRAQLTDAIVYIEEYLNILHAPASLGGRRNVVA